MTEQELDVMKKKIASLIRKNKGQCVDFAFSCSICPLFDFDCGGCDTVSKKQCKARLRKLDELDGFPHQSKSEKIKELQTELANLNTDFANMAQSCMDAEKQVLELKEKIESMEFEKDAIKDGKGEIAFVKFGAKSLIPDGEYRLSKARYSTQECNLTVELVRLFK